MNFIKAGFRTVRENLALIFAEIAWRWVFGAAAWLLMVFTVRTIMEGIDVSSVEVALARTNDVYLITDAVARIVVQVLPRFAAAMLLAVPLLAAAWTLAATVGRVVTLEALLPTGTERSVSDAKPQRRIYVFPLFFLNCLRALFTVATMLAFFGTVFLVSAQIRPSTTPEVAPAYILAWLFLALLVGCLWGLVNWFLALAPIFIVRDRIGAWSSISASLALYRDRKSEYASISAWFGFMRGAALLVAFVAGLSAVATSIRAGLFISVAIALAYFAVADWLYITRMAAFVALATVEDHSSETATSAAPSSGDQGLKLETET